MAKVFLSILGTGFYSKCRYVDEDFCSSETRFAQQATLELINAQEWSKSDSVIILLTEGARLLNWDVSERVNFQKETVPYRGLKKILEEMKNSIPIKDISIPDGKNESEMWEIFSLIYNELREEDELYIDLTHSFRYLPMLLLVLSNYSKFLKRVSIKHISYGNYEARNMENNEAPFVDLLPISSLQDWTFAAADFLENGNTDRLSDLSKSKLQPLLNNTTSARKVRDLIENIRKTTEDIQTCRGMNIINSTYIAKVKSLFTEIQTTFIDPLNPVIRKMEDFFSRFENNCNIQNGFIAAEWCYHNRLYQQAATILQENTISYFCARNFIGIDDDKKRFIANMAFCIIENDLPENKWKINEEDKESLKNLMNDKLLSDRGIVESFGRLTQLRNDINHFGMRSTQAPLTTEKIKKRIQNEMSILFEKLNVKQ